MAMYPSLRQGQGRSPLFLILIATTALLTSGATTAPPEVTAIAPLRLADITLQVPVVIPHYPVIVVPRREVEPEPSVTLQFVAQGDDWATIYLDDRRLFQAFNTRRTHAVTLSPGAYRLEITGVSRFEVWGSGYLDVGREGSHILVIRYGKETGIEVAGDPYTWIPD